MNAVKLLCDDLDPLLHEQRRLAIVSVLAAVERRGGPDTSDPFELYDLPLDAMVRTIERELLHALGRTELPPPLAPIKYRLT